MSNEQILKKAIEKAIKGGYRIKDSQLKLAVATNDYYTFIFSHDFAKAFWGDEEVETKKGRTFEQYYKEEKESLIKDCGLTKEDIESNWITDIPVEEIWAYHLKQMVLTNDPLKYLEKFLR